MTENRKQFLKERKRLLNAIKREEKKGIMLSMELIPEIPKHVTKKALEDIKLIKPKTLREIQPPNVSRETLDEAKRKLRTKVEEIKHYKRYGKDYINKPAVDRSAISKKAWEKRKASMTAEEWENFRKEASRKLQEGKRKKLESLSPEELKAYHENIAKKRRDTITARKTAKAKADEEAYHKKKLRSEIMKEVWRKKKESMTEEEWIAYLDELKKKRNKNKNVSHETFPTNEEDFQPPEDKVSEEGIDIINSIISELSQLPELETIYIADSNLSTILNVRDPLIQIVWDNYNSFDGYVQYLEDNEEQIKDAISKTLNIPPSEGELVLQGVTNLALLLNMGEWSQEVADNISEYLDIYGW